MLGRLYLVFFNYFGESQVSPLEGLLFNNSKNSEEVNEKLAFLFVMIEKWSISNA